MKRCRWTPAAADDLIQIVRYIQEENPEVARQVAQNLIDRLEMLLVFPSIGKPGEEPGTREFATPPYITVYRIKEDVVELLHIWHGARKRHL